LARLLGRARAIRYLYGGNLVSADEALSKGFTDIICNAEPTRKEVRDYAVALSQNPVETLATIPGARLWKAEMCH
jgi:enoyl-CoA hydratase/carnithine racemase